VILYEHSAYVGFRAASFSVVIKVRLIVNRIVQVILAYHVFMVQLLVKGLGIGLGFEIEG
jgi:hypothetical protein